MRHPFLILAVAIMLAGCGDNTKQEAQKLLMEAQTHFEQGDLDAARKDIDSLRKTFPNIVETRKGALKLHQQAQVDEHKKALKATPEELTLLTRTRMKRDSIRTQFETLGMKIRYIHQKQKE